MAKEAVIRDVHVERYYPNVLAPAKEFKVIAEVENPEFAALWKRWWKWYLNTFVCDLDYEGAARWEYMIGIRPKATDTLDERRAEILVRINATLPYTHRRLEQMLNALCGAGLYEIDLDYNKYNLAIITNPDVTKGLNRISTLLRAIVPANLTLDIVLELLLPMPIHHRADILQIVDARHNIWNLGNVERAKWDGEYSADGTMRGGGIIPTANYRERQQHEVAMQMYTDAWQRQRWYNIADGSVIADGSHMANGSRLAGLVEHTITITPVIDGVEKEATPI